MALIKSISGMRGTLGGSPGDNLTPIDIVEFTSAYGMLIKRDKATSVVVGRDGRISGPQVHGIVIHTLRMMGIDVIDLGLSTTPTVEMEVISRNASGGIVITASHNDMSYNALKFLNDKGEFISAEMGEKILDYSRQRNFTYSTFDKLGSIKKVEDAIERHILKIIKLDLVNLNAIRQRKFKIVADCINSTGALALPLLFKALHCDYVLINDVISGSFAHNPEPLKDNLLGLSEMVRSESADIGIAIDPDVDRLAFIDENGAYCGEEYSLVMISDFVLSITPGSTVSNLSSTQALRDITEKHAQQYYAAPVGEVNVVKKMKEVNAVVGGEGNGGIIYPPLHYGRDALVGIALMLSALAQRELSMSEYRKKLPDYLMRKDKIELSPHLDVDNLLEEVSVKFKDYNIDRQDGIKIYFDGGWVHLRKSNTEPIIRVYSEAKTELELTNFAKKIGDAVTEINKV